MSTKSELVGGEGEGGVIGAAAAARSGIDGRAALLQLLEDAGVDKAGPRGKILRFPAADVCLSHFNFFQTPFLSNTRPQGLGDNM